MGIINILAIGDVVGSMGCDFLRQHLPALKKLKGIDITIVNGENSADGNGIHKKSSSLLFESGADVITNGNHTFRRFEIYDELNSNPFIIRPANFPDSAPGTGLCIVDKGRYKVAVLNMMGVVYLENLDCPFKTADRLIRQAHDEGAKIMILDFHAEATSEKRALGFYLDGKISAFFGTHTHVQTADEEILPGGTGYITDIGMTGPSLSVLGVEPSLAISRLKEKLPVKFEYSKTKVFLNGCIFTVDLNTGKTLHIERIEIKD